MAGWLRDYVELGHYHSLEHNERIILINSAGESGKRARRSAVK